jgi:hypothetical protein
VITPEMVIKMVDPRTIQPPHCRCGTNNKISTRKASRVTRRVGNSKIRRPSKYLAEWDGECRCPAAASPRATRFMNAATGWTMRRDDRELRVFEGRFQLPASSLAKRPSIAVSGSAMRDLMYIVPVVYPTRMPLHLSGVQ